MRQDEAYQALEQNLHNIYSKCASKITSTEVRLCIAFKASHSAWPNYVMGPSYDEPLSETLVEGVKKIMECGVWPRFWIRQNINIPSPLPEIDPSTEIRHIMRWPGMIAPIAEAADTLPEGIAILQISTIDEAKKWHSIANQVLFRNPPLSLEIINQLVAIDSVCLYMATCNGKPAATLLLNYENESAGIYMVACLPQFRKKGIVSSLVMQARYDAGLRNCKTIVLQANKESFSLYSKLGFQQVSHFDIYWLMAK